MRRVVLLVFGFGLGACSDRAISAGTGTDGDGTDGASASSTSGASSGTGGASSDPTTGATSGTTTGTDTSGGSTTCVGCWCWDDPGALAHCEPDFGGPLPECDALLQDCPAGEKCMPWANDGGTVWNAVKCAPLALEAGGLGDSCTVEGSPVSGVDSCDAGLMCWNVDPDTLQGTCTALCSWTDSGPGCAGDCTACVFANDGVLPLCVAKCDPVTEICAPEQLCEGAGCWIGTDPPTAAAGEACELASDCLGGAFCMPVDAVPFCGGSGCCAEFCDLTAADPCPGAPLGVECVPWLGQDPGDGCLPYANVGICASPP